MITLKELAKQLNVSVSTVSKALNGSPEISEATAKRIKELAKHLNYQPNKIALSLKSNQTKTIGVIIPDIMNRFFAKVLYSIQQEATNLGYNIITCISNESFEKERDSLKILANGSVDGFIMALSEETQQKEQYDHINEVLGNNIPVVLFDRVSDKLNCDKVVGNDLKSIEDAINTLFDKGRKHIAFLTRINALSVGKLRAQGFMNAMNASDYGLNKGHMVALDKSKDIEEQLIRFFKNNPEIDGVVTADNISGTVAINALKKLNKSVPEHVSVIGFTSKTIAGLSEPRLVAIRQDCKGIGRQSAHLLVDRIKSKSQLNYKNIIVNTTLTEGKSI
jgi:LacI family transcriptional regulator